MSQVQFCREGAIQELDGALRKMNAARILVVAGRTSYEASGAASILSGILRGNRVSHYVKPSGDVTLPGVLAGLQVCRQAVPDVVLSVGGGSVIDMAKLVCGCSNQVASPEDILRGREMIRQPCVPLVAVPTTSGSGSEATHFAVVYIERKKYSVAHRSLRPSVAIVDPLLTYGLSPRLTAIAGMDALCQAIESLWSVGSCAESESWASEAVTLIMANLEVAVLKPTPASRESMSRAAHLAGKAIDITKTTAPHALSYALTTEYGIPHGHAVALTLGSLLEFNFNVSDENSNDSRGASHVREVLKTICSLMGARDCAESRESIGRLMDSIGLETHLGPLGITTPLMCATLAARVNPERLANNPRLATREQLSELLAQLL